jgi:hypothetical protein
MTNQNTSQKTTGQPAPAVTWNEWLAASGLQELAELPEEVGSQPWCPGDEDRKAAWELYAEMRTRISTQPLHYRAGVEPTTLESIVQIFRITRELLRKYHKLASCSVR